MSTRKRMRDDGAAKASKAKKRAIARYGADAVAKYYTPKSRMALVRRETGYNDYSSGVNLPFDTTGSIQLIATVAQGTTVGTRVGKKIMWKSLQMRGMIISNAAANYNNCCLLVVYDKRPTGSLPAITDILDAANAAAMNNDANSGRFVILSRRQWILEANAGAPNGKSNASVDDFVKINRYCEYKAAGTGAIADISSGAVYVVSVGSNAPGTGAAASNFAFRMRFIDV